MKYINEIIILMGLCLLAYGMSDLWGIPVASILLGIIFLVLALFKPLLEAIRGNHVFNQVTDTESRDQ